jgi:RHS repeat-associated protein
MKALYKLITLIVITLVINGCFLYPLSSHGQTFNFKTLERDSLKTANQIKQHGLNDTIVVSHDKWDEMVSTGASYASNFKFKSVHAFVRFSVNHSFGLKISTPYTLRLTYKIYGFSDPLNPTVASQSFIDTLTIGFNPDSLSTYQDKQYKKYSNFHKAMIVLTGLYKIDGAGGTPQAITLGPGSTFDLLNFNVEGAILFQPYYKKAYVGSYQPAYGSAGTLKTEALTATNDYLPVRWTVTNGTLGGALALTPAKYELEWTYVDNYKVTPTAGSMTGTVSEISASNLNYNFTDNATRVWLDTNYYQIPLIYQKGYVLYRVRLVRPDSVEYRYPVYGNFTVADAGTVSGAAASGKYQITTAHLNDSLNWQYTVSFAEQGKYKHVMSYYDGMLKNRQSITRFNSLPRKLIATEQVYDYEGRPSISILPTPITSLAFRYQLNLALNRNTGLPYRAKDFDSLQLSVCPLDPILPPLSHSSPADIYYSPGNPEKTGFQKFVPDAGGYPLVQTIYSPGYDERVEKQGGAGDTLQIGYTHNVKNDYVGTEQMDINRIFGTNIGWAGFYRKTVSRDPNGQLSLNITDYKGKTMMSSMVGLPDTMKHAIVSNENLSESVQYTEDFLAGTSQQIIGNKRILDKNFFNEADGNNTAQYVYSFKPFATFCSNKYLTVRAKYDYTIFDECGVVKAHKDSLIGITGVVSSPALITTTQTPPLGFHMDKGKHSLHKELTINVEDVDKAVDSLMAQAELDDCMKTEPWFIRQSVLSKQFPCPPDPSEADPSSCDGKKYEMMQELYPNPDSSYIKKKYGIYKIIDGVVVGSGNSDFTLFCGPGTNPSGWTGEYPSEVIENKSGPVLKVGNWTSSGAPTPSAPGQPYIVLTNGDTLNCKYRYQNACVVTLPASVTKYGQTYTNLQQIPVQDFINIFNDDIAEALLPLHPEYCDLLGCIDDPFERKMRSIPDADIATQLGLLHLSDMIIADPLYPYMQSNSISYPNAFDTLAYIGNGALSLDHLALTTAYCNSADNNMSGTCQADMFASQIAAGTLINDFVKNKYFKAIRDLYLGNRSRYRFNMNSSGYAQGGCATCSPIRMELVPDPVFADDNADVIAVMDSLMNGFATSGAGGVQSGAASTSAVVNSYLNLVSGINMDTLGSYSNSAVNTYVATSNVIMQAAVDSIVVDLVNCYSPTGGTLSGVSSYLMNLYTTGQVSNLQFTPAQILAALTANNFPTDDICNPYLVNYNNAMTPPESTDPDGLLCGNQIIFDDITTFLNLQTLTALQNTGTSYTATLGTSNQFEAALKAQLGSPSTCSVVATIDSAQHLYTLNYTSGANSVKLYIKAGLNGACQYPFMPASGITVSLQAQCTKDLFGNFPAGYIGNYSFAIVAKRTGASSGTSCNLKAWNDKITINSIGSNPIGQCMPCTQLKTLYKQFMDTATAYQVKGTDHPYYTTMLRNFINSRLNKAYSGNQYLDFIESCSLSDSLAIRKYAFHVVHVLSSESAMFSFVNGITAIDPTLVLNALMYKSGTSYFEVDINLIDAPKNKLRLLRTYFSSFPVLYNNIPSVQILGPTSVGLLSVKASSGFTPGSGIFSGSAAPFTFSSFGVLDVWNGTAYEPTTIYRVNTPDANAFSENNRNADRLTKYLYDNGIDAQYFSSLQTTINQDYYTPEKQAFLKYNYGFQSLPPNIVLDTLQAQDLVSGISLFSGKQLSYGCPANPGAIQNLYVGDPATMTNSTQYPRLQYILDHVTTGLSGHLFFGTGANMQNITVPTGQLLTAYRCSDTAFWYRYFGGNDTLYNVFLKVPAYVDASDLASYTLISVNANLGDLESRSFKVVLHSNSAPIHDLTLNGYTDFMLAKNKVLSNVLLAHAITEGIPVADTIDNCERNRLITAITQGKINYRMYADSIKEHMRGAFFDYVMNGGITENLFVSYQNQRFNYTLYNYDRAGNLTSTVPPAGVNPLTGGNITAVDGVRTAMGDLTPSHTKLSVYKYNTLNQVVDQQTPDGGRTEYFYDAAGRAIFSQNEKQRTTGRMTYTLYDKQGRIVETGQAKIACTPYFPPYSSPNPYSQNPCTHYVNGMITPFPPEVQNLLGVSHDQVTDYVRSLQREEVVVTHYDDQSIDLEDPTAGTSGQENLRKRVADIKYFDYLQPVDSLNEHYNYAMHFSYDVEGNVKTLTRDYPAWKLFKQQFKRIDYDYDVISGKVNLLSYNKGYADQFFQRYNYDADNRITKVETSSDGYIWMRDAEYEYYQHGPLARMSLGDLRVQGVDYAYTIQGWLKAINGDLLDSLKDMGRDAVGNSIHAFDAVALTLDYFKGDYKPIGDSLVTHISSPLKSMYNGNIPRATTSLIPFPDLASTYTYDQLNRIVRADYANLNRQDATLTNTANYYSKYAYDPDGNLKKLVRNGNKTATLLMDSLVYRYTGNALSDNKLQNVNDYAANNYDNDLRNHTNAAISRYLYDETGNVIKDQVAGQDTIVWNHYNKVLNTRNDSVGSGLRFAYDGAGNRFMKTVTRTVADTTTETSDYYVRDAQGNILAVYKADERYAMKKSEWIEYIMVEYATYVNQVDFLNWIIKPYYAQDGYFKKKVIDEISKNNDYSKDLVNSHPVSFYIKNNAAVKSNILSHSGDYPDFYQHLAAYSANTGSPVLGTALFSYTTEEDRIYNMFKDLGAGDQDIKKHILDIMCTATDSLFHNIAVNQYGITYDTTDCYVNADALISVGAEDFNSLGTAVDQMVKNEGYAADYLKFLNALGQDSAVLNYGIYTDIAQNGVLIPYAQDALRHHSSDSLLGGFFDYWNEAGLILHSTTDDYSLLEIAYDNDVTGLLNGYITNVSGGVPTILYNSLAAIPTLTSWDFIHKLSTAVVVDSIIHTVYESVLKYQRISLAEHDLYGSSRLGTKDYLPGQYYLLWDNSGPYTIVDTVTLAARRPWYSSEYNDNIKSITMSPWGMTDLNAYLVSHQAGQKQYELTNHLGNVQATISDLPVAEGPDKEITSWAPALASVYDYYPFGMLMPGRYASDTTGKCMTISQTRWTTQWVDSCVELRVSEWATYGGPVIITNSNNLEVTSATASDGITLNATVLPGIVQNLSINFVDVVSGGAYVQVSEYVGGTYVMLGSMLVTTRGRSTLSIQPKTNLVRVDFWGPGHVKIADICYKVPKQVQTTMLVDVCNGVKDRYRFGFNGQEKVNEWAGIGNFMDYKERGQDTRIARFLSRDPLANNFPWYSPYQFAGNSPILFIDLDGTEPAKGTSNYGKNIIVGVINHRSITNKFLMDPNSQAPYARNNENWITSSSAVDFAGSANFLRSFQKKANNLVLGAHGGYKNGISVIAYTAADANVNYITADDIYTYQGENQCSLDDAKINAIQNLQTIIGAVKNGGNLILNACNVNQDGGTLGKAIQSLADYKVNVYLTPDYIVGGYEQNGTRSMLDTRAIMEKETVFSKDKIKNIVYSRQDYKKGIYKIGVGKDTKPEKLNKNIVYNTAGAPVSTVDPVK